MFTIIFKRNSVGINRYLKYELNKDYFIIFIVLYCSWSNSGGVSKYLEVDDMV